MTTAERGSGPGAPSQVRQVARGLRRTYIDSGLLDLSDLEGKPAEEREPRELSRALAAQAVRLVTGFSPEHAARTVIDGVADQGIDALAVVEGAQPHIYLVQAKWSKTGRAPSERSAVMELLAGLRLIDSEDFTPFNPRGRQLAELARKVMDSGAVPVTQVVALMRSDEVTPGFLDAIANGEKEFNKHGAVLGHRIVLAPEIWQSVRDDYAPQPVSLTADLFPWFSVMTPFESYQGIVYAAQVAEWAGAGDRLFTSNIRNPLGRTAINNSVIETLTSEPAYFWYYNNGITILCDSAEKLSHAMLQPHVRPLALRLHNASVVNGAQTVRSIAEAVAGDTDAGGAQVGVRIIVVGADAEFAKKTTQAANRQNRVEARDFIALESVQAEIMADMRIELGLEYVVRRGELEPAPETGCSVVEAALALACAHSESKYAARIATDLDVLWERGSQGIYDVLFRPRPSAYLLWNAVNVLREVRRTLLALRPKYEGRAVALAEHGVYLLTHLTFRSLDTEAISEPDHNLEWLARARDEIPGLVARLLPETVNVIDRLYGERSQVRAVCADISRSREVVATVLRAGTEDIATSTKYDRVRPAKRRRRPNAVSVLIDRNVLAEGEALALSDAFPAETEALADWLAQDPQRGRATWVPHRLKPILWAVDGNQYSPSGLITSMWESAGWEDKPVANQGTKRWVVASTGESLADLAWRVLEGLEETD
ncbi:AIPR family protein [Nocardia puris]|uniref:AIPR protein n=1 Tax=Nocardia puris TaxID=208602 RepID=A0A366DQX5_9NOCA|nr:AIPR family protein [Nocardia puris]RBO92480.1 AIPR protein [Nocardia puris]